MRITFSDLNVNFSVNTNSFTGQSNTFSLLFADVMVLNDIIEQAAGRQSKTPEQGGNIEISYRFKSTILSSFLSQMCLYLVYRVMSIPQFDVYCSIIIEIISRIYSPALAYLAWISLSCARYSHDRLINLYIISFSPFSSFLSIYRSDTVVNVVNDVSLDFCFITVKHRVNFNKIKIQFAM